MVHRDRMPQKITGITLYIVHI